VTTVRRRQKSRHREAAECAYVRCKADDHARFELLSAKAQEGTLSSKESEELEGFLHIDSLLAIMRLKAERSLARAS
jgi:hypothetical protein